MSRRTERPYQVDGADKLARHSAVRCSVPEINGPVVPREFTSLIRETGGPIYQSRTSRTGQTGGTDGTDGMEGMTIDEGGTDGI